VWEKVSTWTGQIFGAGFRLNCIRFGAEVLVNLLNLAFSAL
jgi:hypothetical protein